MKPALSFIGGFALVYALVAFVLWDINAATWTEPARFITALFGLTAGCMAIALVQTWPFGDKP
jgi:hypothetical protein